MMVWLLRNISGVIEPPWFFADVRTSGGKLASVRCACGKVKVSRERFVLRDQNQCVFRLALSCQLRQ